MGFEQRLIRFANELIHLLNKRNPTSFKTSEHLLKEIENHTCAIQAPARIERLRMAQRLMRWLQDQKENQDRAGNFASEATAYVRDGGFVDWARNALYRGDGCPELGKAFSRILSRALKIRETQNEKFAELLVEWTAAGSSGDDILKVEDVLRKVVSPAAMHDRVLFIVMDGMSHAVFAELKENLLGDTAWVEITLEGMDSEKPVVALFPTVTDVCRRSLLCGNPSSDIDRLMGSPVLVNQKKMCGRAAPADKKIRSFLETLDQHGGTMLQPALSQAMAQPLFRFRGIISIMQRILNVDGYPVLSFDTASNTISINYELMQTQFEI